MTSVNDELDDIAIKNDARQGELILKAVYEFLGCFVVYPSEHARVAHVLWIAHTHLMAGGSGERHARVPVPQVRQR